MNEKLPQRELAAQYRREALALLDEGKKEEGIALLIRADRLHDAEAAYHLGVMLLQGVITLKEGDSFSRGMEFLQRAAAKGVVNARSLINRICEERYSRAIQTRSKQLAESEGRLRDFDGSEIRIDRKGLLVPVDAVLEYRDGSAVLVLSANISFLLDDELPDPKGFRNAVLAGIRQWQGTYQVFGGQTLRVEIHLTTEQRLLDSVMVVPVSDDLKSMVSSMEAKFGGEKATAMLGSGRSFATIGVRKWSVRSPKVICIQSKDQQFTDLAEIRDVAKHEFGHVLGLGDLYASAEDHLSGVEKGQFPELDCYYISNLEYNLVMCDHHGPISNNDIEMVVLAFSENRMQLYQTKKNKEVCSYALGRGN